MVPRVILSMDAERDLTELFEYIANDSGVDRAEAVLRRLDETMKSLARYPRIGRVRSELSGSPRSFSVWPWLIVYEPIGDGPGIFVWRVVDGRRDIPRVIPGQPRR